VSPRSDGRRGRGRKTDPAEETATWLLEMEQQEQAERHDEEEWAQQLRSTRAASATGQFPAVPMEGPGGAATPAPPASPHGGYPSGGEATRAQRPLDDFPGGYAGGGYAGGGQPGGGYSGGGYAGGGQPAGGYSGGGHSTGEYSTGEYSTGDYSGGGQSSGGFSGSGYSAGGDFGNEYSGGGYPRGESAPIHPPLADRYRSAGGATPRPAPAPATDPGATAWSWETPQPAGYEAPYEAPRATWEPGLQAQPQGLSDQQFGSPAPWETEDPGFGAPPAAEPQPWDTASESEHWGGKWPFEETTQSWEPDDRSWLWPTQEAPSNTGSWEADPSAWQGQPGQGQATSTPAGPGGLGSTTAWAPGETTGQMYGYPGTGEQPAHGDPAYGYNPAGPDPQGSGLGASAAPAGSGPWTDGSTRAWYEAEAPPSEPTSMLEGDDEQVVRLGRAADDDPMGLGRMDESRAQAARSMRTEEARRVQPSADYSAAWQDRGGRSSWPRVVALISWIILLMVVCWFYVFPWLERILPENF
jgi:hypothetical protein